MFGSQAAAGAATAAAHVATAAAPAAPAAAAGSPATERPPNLAGAAVISLSLWL